MDSGSTKRKNEESPMEQDEQTEVNGIQGSIKAKTIKRKKYTGEIRRVHVPAHRYTPIKQNWIKIFTPLVEHLMLQVRFNLKTRHVELKPCPNNPNIINLQKGADFVKAFVLGFEVEDALALIRLDDLFIETFEIKDVKTLQGDHLSRAIGRLAGKDGRTKYTIENATKTRIVLADSKIHILGSYQNIPIARRSISYLITGQAPSKVYGHLRNVVDRISSRF